MSKYTKACCDRVIELGRMGYHHEEMASDLGVTRKTLHNWRKSHEAFDAAMEMADTHSAAWWASIPRREISGEIEQKVCPTKWVFSMKNKCGWVDRIDQHTTHSGQVDVDVSAEELIEQLREFGVDVDAL